MWKFRIILCFACLAAHTDDFYRKFPGFFCYRGNIKARLDRVLMPGKIQSGRNHVIMVKGPGDVTRRQGIIVNQYMNAAW